MNLLIRAVMSRTLTVAITLGLTLSVGCSSAEPDTEVDPVGKYLLETWGITIYDLDDWDGSQMVLEPDGTARSFGEGRIKIDGLGERSIRIDESVTPFAQDGVTTLFVSLLDGSDERYFHYNPVRNFIIFGAEDQGIGVDKLGDGTYEVWTFAGNGEVDVQGVTDGYEALRLVEERVQLSQISPHVLLMAFAMAHTPSYEARMQVKCNGGSARLAAQPPVVCDIFKEFCDCAACLVVDRPGPCDQCPNL